MTSHLDADLLRYFTAREQQRADRVQSRLDALTPRERWLVHEAAVMGYVQGSMAGEIAADRSGRAQIPPDSQIVASVILGCDSMSDRYPLLTGSVSDLIRQIVRTHGRVRRGDLVATVAALGAVDRSDAVLHLQDLIVDEVLVDVNDEIWEVT